jgi:hypothetical protein
MQYGLTEVFVKQDYFAALRVKLIKKRGESLILLKDQGDHLQEIREITTSKKIYPAPAGFLPRARL